MHLGSHPPELSARSNASVWVQSRRHRRLNHGICHLIGIMREDAGAGPLPTLSILSTASEQRVSWLFGCIALERG